MILNDFFFKDFISSKIENKILKKKIENKIINARKTMKPKTYVEAINVKSHGRGDQIHTPRLLPYTFLQFNLVEEDIRDIFF